MSGYLPFMVTQFLNIYWQEKWSSTKLTALLTFWQAFNWAPSSPVCGRKQLQEYILAEYQPPACPQWGLHSEQVWTYVCVCGGDLYTEVEV